MTRYILMNWYSDEFVGEYDSLKALKEKIEEIDLDEHDELNIYKVTKKYEVKTYSIELVEVTE